MGSLSDRSSRNPGILGTYPGLRLDDYDDRGLTTENCPKKEASNPYPQR